MLILRQASEALWILTVGGIITGLPIAVIGYFLSRWGAVRYNSFCSTPTYCGMD